MPPTHDTSIPSKVAILKHPLHAIVVVFPVAFLTSTFVTDALYWWRGNPFWAEASFWLLVGGFGMGLLAAMLGFADFLWVSAMRRYVTSWSHFIAAIMLLALAGTNLGLRWADPVATVLPWGMFTSGVMALMVGITGWLGGTLTFRYGIGTYKDERDGRDDVGPFIE